MITKAKVKGWFIEKGKRILKVLQWGVKSVPVAGPFGDDSNPIKNMTAIMAETSVKGEPVIIGYIHKNQIAKVGEKRIFSLKENGETSTYIHLKNDEVIEIGGNSDFLVRFFSLKTSIDNKDNLINQELEKIRLAIQSVGGTYVKSNVSTNLDAAKTEKVKVS